MPIVQTDTKPSHVFKVGAYSAEKLRVIRFMGREGLSDLFHFTVDLASTDQKVDFDQVVGQPALLTAKGNQGTRQVHGLVSLFEQTGKKGKWTFYRAEVVPTVWKLGLRTTCRIFQEQTIPGIIKKVLLDADIPANQFRMSLDMSRYKARIYCVQYAETDLNFISRLMEQYGIWYYFEHSETKHVLVLADAPSVYAMPSGTASIRYRAPTIAGASAEEHISDFRYHSQIRCEAVKLKDFDFEKPALKVVGDATAKTDGKLEAYHYLGECWEASERAVLAKVRLEEAQTFREMGAGRSDCGRLIPGFRFTLDKYDRSDLNREYVAVQVVHQGNQRQILGAETAGQVADGPHYENEFQCIPSDVPFRPTCRAGRPRIEGSQTAIVVGPPGEEIHTDKYGRAKVQFHWDREGTEDDKSSCWIRVSQTHAGKGFGSVDIPRVGEEVIVSFLDGDPDRPIIIGRVYNGHNMPPNGLPASGMVSGLKSNTTPGGGGNNGIMMDDTKGKEGMTIHAQYDMNTTVEHDANVTVVSGKSTFSVNAGTHTATVKGAVKEIFEATQETTVTGAVKETFQAGYDNSTKNAISITSETSSIYIHGATSIQLHVGASKLWMASDGNISLEGVNVTIKGTSSVTIKGGVVHSEADSENQVKGAIVLTEGTATNTVKGGMVMLNP